MQVPVFDFEIENPKNLELEFVKRYAAGRTRIKRGVAEILVGAEDAEWVAECFSAVVALPRRDICVLYAYSTQNTYGIVNGFLRHSGDPSTYNTGLVFDSSQDNTRLWGLDAFRASVRDGSYRKYVDGAAPASVIKRFANASAARNLDMVDRLYPELWPFTNAAFDRMCHDQAVNCSPGIYFYPQAVTVLHGALCRHGLVSDSMRGQGPVSIRTPTDFKRVIPHITNLGWVRILQRFVSELDTVFDRMPPTRRHMTVFRGARSQKGATISADRAYMSTSLDVITAREFARSNKGKCFRITIPTESRVVPMIAVSRYRESEVLLPRARPRYTYGSV